MSQPPRGETPFDALARAGGHARAAAGELWAALLALLDAAALGHAGVPAAEHPQLRAFARWLDGQRARAERGQPLDPAPVLCAMAEALEQEIRRWEERARHDAEARSVLRAFLGLREILWEFGVRAEAGGPPESGAPRSASPDDEAPPRRPLKRRAGPRVQRIDVEG